MVKVEAKYVLEITTINKINEIIMVKVDAKQCGLKIIIIIIILDKVPCK